MLKKLVILAVVMSLSASAFAADDFEWIGATGTTGDWSDVNMWQQEGVPNSPPASRYPGQFPNDPCFAGDSPLLYTAGITVDIGAGVTAGNPPYLRLGMGNGEGGPNTLGPVTLNIAAGGSLALSHWMVGEHYDSTTYGPLRKAGYFVVNNAGDINVRGRISMWTGYHNINVLDGGNLNLTGYLHMEQPGARCSEVHGGPAVHLDNYNIIEVMSGGSFEIIGDGVSEYSGQMLTMDPTAFKAGQNSIILHGRGEFFIKTDWAVQAGRLPGGHAGWEQLLQDMANGGSASYWEGSVFVTYADDTTDNEVSAFVFQRGGGWVVSAVPKPPPMIGDFSEDGDVDYEDVEILASQWLSIDWPEDGLVAHWKMDDVAADQAVEDSHGGYDGTAPQNTEDMNAVGRFEGALAFAGDGGSVDIPDFDLTGNWTISFWAKCAVETPVGAGDSIVLGNAGDSNNYVYLINGNRVRFKADDGTKINWAADTDFYDKWRMVTLVAGSGTIELFLDGVSQGPQAVDPKFKFYNIGAGHTTASYSFNGAIDEVMLYDRTLSKPEVEQLYQVYQNPTDLHTDGVIDLQDFAVFGSHWRDSAW